MELNLLEKTELWITDIGLEKVNLSDFAKVTAAVLGLPPDKVLVVDVRQNHITLDVLQRIVQAESIMGKKQVLLQELAGLPGVTIRAGTDIHSDGILGYIGLSEKQAGMVLARTAEFNRNINARKRGKVKIFPTGFEIIEGRIEDTNTPFLQKKLEEAGFMVEVGPAIRDSLDAVITALADSAEKFGAVITTGGVGAEDKDFTVEAITRLDPEAATPYIVKFTQGQGRHVKDGVRIGVGEYRDCLLVGLPGPHDEVATATPAVIAGLKKPSGKEELADAVVDVLRHKLLEKTKAWGHHPHACHRQDKG